MTTNIFPTSPTEIYRTPCTRAMRLQLKEESLFEALIIAATRPLNDEINAIDDGDYWDEYGLEVKVESGDFVVYLFPTGDGTYGPN